MSHGMRICFYDKDGKQICIPIYTLVRRITWPWEEQISPGDPSPWRFMEHPAVRPEIVEDVGKIAVLDRLASTLSAERSKPIQAAIRAAIPQDLPNVKISF
jgi:hypothetical protein